MIDLTTYGTHFSGAWPYTMDRKGRVILPPAFREAMGPSFVVTRGPRHTVLLVRARDWQGFRDCYRADESFRRFYLASAVETGWDGVSGRFLVPWLLRSWASLRPGREVAVCGAGLVVQVMTLARWEALGEQAAPTAPVLTGPWQEPVRVGRAA